MSAFLEVEGLTKHFGGVAAVEDLSFQVRSGEIFSVIGPNGAGKTTVFNCISGLYAPTGGCIRFKDREISGRQPHRIARSGVARTFQNIELFEKVTTMENLMLGRHQYLRSGLWRGAAMLTARSRAAREEIRQREVCEGIVDRLDLQAARDRYVAHLPYGLRKRVELGRALAMEPSLLLLDEPTAGMTHEEREDLIFVIQDLRDELGLTILLIEHHMPMIMQISDRVLAMDFGRKISQGSPAEVARHPDVIRAYLGGEEPAHPQ